MSVKIGNIEFLNASPDAQGWWRLQYQRDETICSRHILDADGQRFARILRTPSGWNLLECAAKIVGRKLTPTEESSLLELKVIK